MNKLPFFLFLTAPILTNAGDDFKLPPASDTTSSVGWRLQSVSAGPTWRLLGSVDYNGRSNSQNVVLPRLLSGNPDVSPPIGTTGAFGDRTYLDGFVNLDPSTSADGDTWYWGYDSPSQIQGEQLAFSAFGTRSEFAEDRRFSGNFGDDETRDGFAPQIDLLFAPPVGSRLPFDGVLVSFWAFSEDTGNRFSNFSETQTRSDYRVDFTDRYDIAVGESEYEFSPKGAALGISFGRKF